MKKNSKLKTKNKKARDEVMLEHLTKTFNCGPHKSKKDYDRKREKELIKQEAWRVDHCK